MESDTSRSERRMPESPMAASYDAPTVSGEPWGERLMTGVRPLFTVNTDRPEWPQKRRLTMNKYLIERTVPGAGQMDAAGLADPTSASVA